MSTMKCLKIATTRRQLLTARLAALTVTGLNQALARSANLPLKIMTNRTMPDTKATNTKRIVMLDPGHKGIDTDTIGHSGSEEKQVVLAIAKNLHAILPSRVIGAHLTQTNDTSIPLYDRMELAHQHEADLFMSIHADGFISPGAAGSSLFTLSNRDTNRAMAKYFSKRENAADNLAGRAVKNKDRNLQQVLFDLAQTDTIKNSLTLESHTLRQSKPFYRLHSKPTEQAIFVILTSSSTSSVLVKTSFITNLDEKHPLGSVAFRQKTDSTIATSTMSYFNWFDHQKIHAKRS